jgi:CubicO group peptidase (beta-lactamase class C family)
MKKALPYIFILLINVAFGQDKRLQKIDSVVSSWYSNNEFNGNILIAEKGNIIFNKSYGKANEETGEMLNENSQFELASVSKQFTATAIMLLKERNQLTLEDPITKYFPELVNYNKVTIKNLLNHTGGIPSFEEQYQKITDNNFPLNNEGVIKILLNTKPEFEVNKEFQYSNTGYVLLSLIVKKISNQSLNDFLQQNVFEKLGMNRTKIIVGNNLDYGSNYAFGYSYDFNLDKWILVENHPDVSNFVLPFKNIDGAKSVNSTILDLYKWEKSFNSEQILNKKSIEEMQTPNVLNNNKTTNYGYGLGILVHKQTQKKLIQHAGGIPGYSTFLINIPEDDITIIILSNRTDYECNIPYNTILNTLYHKNLTFIQNKDLQYIEKEKLPIYEGLYFAKNDSIKLTVKGKHLMFDVNGSIPLELKLKEENVLINDINRTEVRLKKDKKGNFVSLVLMVKGQKMKFKKVIKSN